VVERLFAHYVEAPGDLPAEWQSGFEDLDAAGRARRIADFIAGMTDRFAIEEQARVFGAAPELK
jgi:dGTPase